MQLFPGDTVLIHGQQVQGLYLDTRTINWLVPGIYTVAMVSWFGVHLVGASGAPVECSLDALAAVVLPECINTHKGQP